MIPCARRIVEFLSFHTQGALETCKCLAPNAVCLSGKSSRVQTKLKALEKSTMTWGETRQPRRIQALCLDNLDSLNLTFPSLRLPFFSKLFSLSLSDFLFSCLRIAPELSLKGTKVSQCFQRFKVLKAQHSLLALKGGSFGTRKHPV